MTAIAPQTTVAPQPVIAGFNSQNVVNSNSVNALLPGISLGETLNSKYPPAHVREANATIEQPLRDGSVFRITYVFTHGYNLDQNYQYNNAPSTYVWETATGHRRSEAIGSGPDLRRSGMLSDE